MIRENKVRQALKRQENVIGTFVKFSDASTVEILGLAGFDFFVLDNEHVAMNRESMVNLMRAADVTGIVPVVRVRENSAVEILQALDAGALGVQVPQVNTPEEARSVAQSAKYAPEGRRGFAPTHRAAGYGLMDPAGFVRISNDNVLVVCYCETEESVRNIRGISAVDQIDVIFIGPFDLSQSMGLTGQTRHPRVLAAIDQVIREVRAAGKAAGIIAADAREAKHWMAQGVQYITISSDQGMVVARGREIITGLRADG